MEIKINETGEIEELSIIDPGTGVDWVSDLLGNHDAKMGYNDDTGVHEMSRSEFDWWHDLIGRYQKADDRFYALLNEMDEGQAEELHAEVMDIGCDLENYPERLLQICDDHELKVEV